MSVTIFVMIATLLLVEQGKGCAIQSLSAVKRGQRQSKIPHNKERKRKKSGKRVEYHLVLCHCSVTLKCKHMCSRNCCLALGLHQYQYHRPTAYRVGMSLGFVLCLYSDGCLPQTCFFYICLPLFNLLTERPKPFLMSSLPKPKSFC